MNSSSTAVNNPKKRSTTESPFILYTVMAYPIADKPECADNASEYGLDKALKRYLLDGRTEWKGFRITVSTHNFSSIADRNEATRVLDAFISGSVEYYESINASYAIDIFSCTAEDIEQVKYSKKDLENDQDSEVEEE